MVRGGRYYPKLQCCVPFTPVTGPRLLAAPGPLRPAILKSLAEALVAVADARGASGAHITFSGGEEWAALGAIGMLQRRGIQVGRCWRLLLFFGGPIAFWPGGEHKRWSNKPLYPPLLPSS